MTEKIAILSDIHGNSPALEAVLEDIHRNGCQRILVLGDIVNGLDPTGCLELLRQHPAVECIKGNVEHYLLTPDLDVFPKKEESFYREIIMLIQWWKDRLSEANLNWIRNMPELIFRDSVCLAHDSPLDRISPKHWRIKGVDKKYQELCYHAPGITREVLESGTEDLMAFLDSQDLSHLFCGHTHLPFLEKIGSKTICNTGSVGMPLDGDPRPSWVIYENSGNAESRVSLHRVPYDLDKILRMADEVDYPKFRHFAGRETYKTMLTTGIYWHAFI